MPTEISLMLAVMLIIAAAVAGYIIARGQYKKTIASLTEDKIRAETTLEAERRQFESNIQHEKATIEKMQQLFASTSSEALQKNSESFLQLAKENLKQFQLQAEHNFHLKEKQIENLLSPIKVSLDRADEQLRKLEQDRKHAQGALTQQIETLAKTHQSLHQETRNLVQALRRPEVRGRWGEMTLKRLVEISGMQEHCDFFEQEHTTSEQGSIRPDMIIRMPESREVIVDVKTPLDAYLTAIEAPTEEERHRALEQHKRNMRQRVKELSDKRYWEQFKHSPDFVVLFIPGDQFLTAALDLDQQLLEDALKQQIVIATPTSFIALLRTVAYGWRQIALAENAEKMRELGEDLFKRLSTFTDHMSKMGKSLSSSVEHYNKAVGSLERQVLPGARKFTEMGISSNKSIETMEPIEKIVREIS